MNRLADELQTLAARAGYPRVRVRASDYGSGSTVVKGARAWSDLIEHVRRLEQGPPRNRCQIVYRDVREQLEDRFRGAGASSVRAEQMDARGQRFSDYPAGVPTAEAEAIVRAAYDDASLILDLPGRVVFRWVRRATGDKRLATCRRLTEADGDDQGALIVFAVNQPVAGLRRIALHELRHASDVLADRYMELSEAELEERADRFADRMLDLRLSRRRA